MIGRRYLSFQTPLALAMLSASLVFLSQLLFAAQDPASPEVADSPASRRAMIEQMSPEEKEELKRRLDRYMSLDEAERQRVRRLHDELTSDPRGDELRAVLVRYLEWLRTLSPAQRAELLELPPAQRIEQIGSLQSQQEEQRFERLVDTGLKQEDVRLIFSWIDGYLSRYEEELLAALPQSVQQRIRAEQDDVKRRRMLMRMIQYRDSEIDFRIPTAEDLEPLILQLSPEARATLDRASDPRRKVQMMRGWVRAAMLARTAAPQVSKEELEQFFITLPREQQERLESLPRQRMEQALRRLYLQSHHRSREHSPGQNRRPHGDRPHHRPSDRDPPS